MKTVPNSIKKKLQSYNTHIQKSEKLRIEIEEYFFMNGIDTDTDSGNLIGGMITGIIIDTGIDGNIDEAIMLIEKVLNGEE